MKIRPVGAEMFQADGRDRHPDMTNLTVAFHNFANAPKKHITVKRDCYERDEISSKAFCPALP